MSTPVTKAKTIKRAWHLIDLKGQTLGRTSTQIANLLMGKGKTYFTPQLDCGDYVVAINAKEVVLTGSKATDKMYRHHTGFPGGFREYTLTQVQTKDPRRLLTSAVSGMLPKNKLRAPRLKRFKIYGQATHPYVHRFQLKETHAK
jgi:large subunit ribosomal protein L13